MAYETRLRRLFLNLWRSLALFYSDKDYGGFVKVQFDFPGYDLATFWFSRKQWEQANWDGNLLTSGLPRKGPVFEHVLDYGFDNDWSIRTPLYGQLQIHQRNYR